MNSVIYADPASLVAVYDDLAEAYQAAAIEAWAVWVPKADRESAAFLETRGHVLDGSPTVMGARLDQITAAPGGLAAEVTRDPDPPLLGRLNDLAYGYESSFERALGSMSPDVGHWYLAHEGSEPVCGLMIFDHGADAEADWVATVPEARGRGLAGRLLGLALADARDRGRATTTLVATKMGLPVYERLGYRPLGTVEMWERRT